MKTLANLKIGQKGIIKVITAELSLRQRLYDLGLTPGTEIEVIQFAPLGDPLEITLRGYRLSMRKIDAAFVELEESHHD